MPYRSFLTLLILLLSFCLSAAPAVHFGPTPSWVIPIARNAQQPNLRDVNDGYYIELFEQEMNLEKDALYQHLVKKIVSDAGVQGASNLSISFNPAYEQLVVHQITVWRDGTPVDKMDKSAFKILANEQNLSMFIYHGSYTAYLILNDIRKGDKIEYSYSLTGSNPIFNKKFFTSLYFQASDPISQMHYRIVAPATRTFNIKYYNTTEKPQVTTANNFTVYDWNMLNVKGYQYISGSPGWYDPYPHIQISEYKDWKEVADWAYSINAPHNTLTGDAGKRTAKLKEKYGKSEDSLFRAIVEVVQNEVRYMGVELGEYSHRANEPEKVYNQRYGDCKDKSLLLVSMLRSVGLSADMALVNSSSKGHVENELPSSADFNHAIVVAHIGGKDVWIDPTISYQGGSGTDFYCPDYGNALILAPGTNGLTSIPLLTAGEINYTEEYDITDSTSPAVLTVLTTYSANFADDIRAALANQSRADVEKKYLEYYTQSYPRAESNDTIIIEDDISANILKTTERYIIKDFMEYDATSKNYSFSFYARMLKSLIPTPDNKKDFPIAVNYPYTLHYAVHVNLPMGWNIPTENYRLATGSYTFFHSISAAEKTLSLEYELSYFKDNIPVTDLERYRKDYKLITDKYLSHTYSYTPAKYAKDNGINYMAVLLLIVLFPTCAYAGNRIYKTKTKRSLAAPLYPINIGGWLVLPILRVVFGVCWLVYVIINGNYLTTSIWHTYDGTSLAIAFKAVMWSELVCNNILLALCIFCLVLIYNKRDIAPKYMILLFISSAVVVVADNLASYLLFPNTGMAYKPIVQGAFYCIIWVTYMLKADRVRDTFVVPYPHDQPIQMQERLQEYEAADVTEETQ